VHGLSFEQGAGDDEVLAIAFWTTLMSRRPVFPFGIMALAFLELQEQGKQEADTFL